MQQSYNEIEALVRKAARGTGFSWGMAQEAALAARWLSERDAPGLAAIANLLSLLDGKDHSHYCIDACSASWQSRTATLCPVMTGVSLMDFCYEWSQHHQLVIQQVHYPLLLVPFVARASVTLKKPLTLLVDTTISCTVVNGELHTMSSLQWPELAAHLTLAHNEPIEVSAVGTSKPLCASIDEDVLNALNSLAHRTYAPATEQSRRLGAGDNA